MPRKLSKKESVAKTSLITDVDSLRRTHNKLQEELTDKKASLKKIVEEKKILRQKLDETNANKYELAKLAIDEKSNNILPLECDDPLVDNLRLMSVFSCIRWDFKNEDKNTMRGYLSEKDQFRVIDFNRAGSQYSTSDELWKMMDLE